MADLNSTIVRGNLRVTEEIIGPLNVVNLSTGANGQFLSISNNVPTWVNNPNTDTKVTAVGNHYTPANGTDLTVSSSGTASRGSTKVLTNVAIDAAGHITGGTWYTLPSSDNIDTHYTNYLQIKGNGTEAVKFTQNADKTLNLKPGNNVAISATSGEITISATDTSYSLVSNATASGGIKYITEVSFTNGVLTLESKYLHLE